MQGNESEVARLLHQIDLEYQAAQRGLTGLSAGTAKHAFITARMENIGVYLNSRKPCGSFSVLGFIQHLGFECQVKEERECTVVHTLVFLPDETMYVGTSKHYSVVNVLPLSSFYRSEKRKSTVRGAFLSSPCLEGQGSPERTFR